MITSIITTGFLGCIFVLVVFNILEVIFKMQKRIDKLEKKLSRYINETARRQLLFEVFKDKKLTEDQIAYIKSGLTSDLTPEHREAVDNYLREQGNKF